MDPHRASPSLACPTCGAQLRALAGFSSGTLSCDACDGIWLDRSEHHLLPRRLSQSTELGVAGACPICRRGLAGSTVQAATPMALPTCEQHGVWLSRHHLGAITRPDWTRALVQAQIVSNPQLSESQRQELLAAILRAWSYTGSFVRRAGVNENIVNIGLFGGGAELVRQDGTREQLIHPVRPWGLAAVVLLIGAVFTAVAAIFLGLVESWILAVVVAGFLAFVFVGAALMFWLLAKHRANTRLVVDGQAGAITLLKGGAPTIVIPRRLMRAVRVQIHADAGYSDRYNVLVNLGFAELWIEQTIGAAGALSCAERVAQGLNVHYERTLERIG